MQRLFLVAAAQGCARPRQLRGSGVRLLPPCCPRSVEWQGPAGGFPAVLDGASQLAAAHPPTLPPALAPPPAALPAVLTVMQLYPQHQKTGLPPLFPAMVAAAALEGPGQDQVDKLTTQQVRPATVCWHVSWRSAQGVRRPRQRLRVVVLVVA